MSYFAHAFGKAFPVTAETGTFAGVTVSSGLVTDAGVSTAALRGVSDDIPNVIPAASVAPVFGLFNRDSYLSVNLASAEIANGSPLILAASSILPNDKIGPFHGGYAESNKSKYINPRYVTAVYKFAAQAPQQSVWHVGTTNYNSSVASLTFVAPCGNDYADSTAGAGTFTNVPTTTSGSGTGLTVDVVVAGGEITSMTINTPGTGYATGDTIEPDATTLDHDGVGTDFCDTTTVTVNAEACTFDFLCGETYNLFINLSGSPVLRYLNHDAYRLLAAYTGCCPDDSIEPTPVDSTLVFIDWATQIIESPYLKEFVRPVVYDAAGNPWFATAEEAVAAMWPATQVWTNYVSAGAPAPGDPIGGMTLTGAYVDTEFGTCTFQTSDYFGKDFVKMDITLSDEDGQPCNFDGLCTVEECCGFNGQGFGDTYLKEIILHESYLQNKFDSDPRIREITQGNALRDVVDRYAFYDKYVIEHTVPRTNNPSSVHDNDKYRLMVYVPQGTDLSDFETLVLTWLDNAGNHLGAELLPGGEFTAYGDRTACVVAALPVAP
jgi:hypothetical protein